MSKYRILEKIDNSIVERETREHIILDPIVTFYIQEKIEYGIFSKKWGTIQVHKSIDSAKKALEDIIEKHVTTKIHEVNYGN